MAPAREPLPALPAYGSVPISFSTTSVRQVSWVEHGLGGIRIVEVPLDRPFAKDFDDDESEPVTRWLGYGDISHWGIFAAFDDGRRVGGAVVAYDAPDVNLLEGRRELAVLWDIRVHPDVRRTGVGTSLLETSVGFARESGCSVLKVESQNTNPAACRFYATNGFYLGGLRRGGYSDYPDEIQMLWYRDLAPMGPQSPQVGRDGSHLTSVPE